MARITAEDCLRHIQSPFSLVHAAVRRARQLQLGSKPLIMKKYDKTPVIALREIAAGVVEQVDLADKEHELQTKGQITEDEEFSQLFDSSDINIVLDYEHEEPIEEKKDKKSSSKKKAKTAEEDVDDEEYNEDDFVDEDEDEEEEEEDE